MADNNMYTDKLQQGKKARAEIVASLLSSLFERGNLAEGERDQVQELAIRLGQALKLPCLRRFTTWVKLACPIALFIAVCKTMPAT